MLVDGSLKRRDPVSRVTELAARLGHARSMTLDTYSHVLLD
ncbi:MAG TPA: hypothetical protein VFW80_12515 [Gaiellaceae bacterium]|nr:hypothetical protein [Gaiellaceae bacterium]